MAFIESENILKQTQIRSANDIIQQREPQMQCFRTLSGLQDFYSFTAHGNYATRKWCRENAETIRYLQSHPELYMLDGRFWEYPFVFNAVMERAESRIIDIGIGQGIFASILARHGHHVIGVDNYAFCWRDLKHTVERTQVPCLNADARDLGMFKDEVFDIGLLISVIEHIPSNTIWCERRKVTKTGDILRKEVPEKLRVIAEALRVVKSGGLLVITSDIYLDYPPDMNISWRELLGVEGIDREDFNNLSEIYLSDNPIHKGRIASVGIVIEKHGWSSTSRIASAFQTAPPRHSSTDAGMTPLQTDTGDLLRDGEKLFAEGEIDKAKVCFHRVLAQNPTAKEALNNLGVVAFTEGAFDKAETYFRKALRIDNRYIDAIENLGKCAEAGKDYLAAIEAYEKVLHLDDKNTALLNSLGNLYLQLENLEGAKHAYERSIQIKPKQETVHEILSELKYLRRLKGKSVEFRKEQKLNIGFISVWFERGQAYVTKNIRDALAEMHQTFLLARTGAVYPDQPQLETTGFWYVPNLTTHRFYNIPLEMVDDWIFCNDLDIVVFNEEYDWELVEHCNKTGVKTVTYLDYYKEDWKPYLRRYNAVLCSTKRSFNLVKKDCSAHYVGWGIDTELFKPIAESEKKHTFFHNAGWLGRDYRKMTPAVIFAFDTISQCLDDVTLFVHSQAPLHRLPAETNQIIRNNPRISFHVETVPAPGLYAKGKIHVFPSKLEGLGLPLLEGLSCGLPTITTDAPPMNEFVRDGHNGLLVKTARTVTRDDNIAFPETIVDIDDLAFKMRALAQDPDNRIRMSRNARKTAKEALSLTAFRSRINQVFSDLRNRPVGSV